MASRIEIDRVALRAYLNAPPPGDVGRFFNSLGRRTENAAKRNVNIDRGYLRSTIRHRLFKGNRVRVGSGVRYAAAVELGSGIYGPKHRPIRARGGGYMTWVSRKAPWIGQRIAVKTTKGQRPQAYLRRALAEVIGRL